MDKPKLKNGDVDELGRRYIGRQRMPSGRVRELWISEEAFQRRQQKAKERAQKVIQKNELLRSERLAAKYGDKLNSAIGSLKRGMVRANGDIFANYSREGGKVREVWATPEAFIRLQERTKKMRKKQNSNPDRHGFHLKGSIIEEIFASQTARCLRTTPIVKTDALKKSG